VFRGAGLPYSDVLHLLHSPRAGVTPTLTEVVAGDYSNFPYERRRGSFSWGGAPPVPVLRERVAIGGRFVVFSDGSLRVLDEARWREVLRQNPGQE
jgi:hypothetical protein